MGDIAQGIAFAADHSSLDYIKRRARRGMEEHRTKIMSSTPCDARPDSEGVVDVVQRACGFRRHVTDVVQRALFNMRTVVEQLGGQKC